MCCRCVIIIALLSQTSMLLKSRELICAALRSGHKHVKGRILKQVLDRFYAALAILSHDLVIRGWRCFVRRCKWRLWWRWYQDSDVIRWWRRLPHRRRRHCRRRSTDNAVADAGRVCQGNDMILLYTSIMFWPTTMMVISFMSVLAEDRI